MDSEKIGVATDSQVDSTTQDSKVVQKKVNQSSGQSPASIVYVRRRVELDSASNKPTTNKPTEEASHKLEWEERYHHLQMLLNKLNDSSDHTSDHLQMLWSLSSAELSKHAVDLEKRSIQFSLEEAREMQRVAALNVLGRSVNSVKSTSNDG